MKRGDVWTASRAGHDRLVIVVGHDALTSARVGVLVVPVSDVRAPTLIEPTVSDRDGSLLGTAMTPRVGEVDKGYLVAQRGELDAESIESLNIALRAALDL